MSSFLVYLIGVALLISVSIIGTVYAASRPLPGNSRLPLLSLAGFQAIVLLLLVYLAWPLTAMGLARRDDLGEQFMALLAAGDPAAFSLLTSATPAELETARAALNEPVNRPVSWTLRPANPNNIIHGVAHFADGANLNVTLFLEWEWTKGHWRLAGFEVGRDPGGGRARFWLYRSVVSDDWLRQAAINVAVISMLLSLSIIIRNARVRTQENLLA
jgi:hypothetical protein